MRILMVCDDVRIDRRILQEGETLAAAGHEIILLAQAGADVPAFERIGSVKVERLSCVIPKFQAPPGAGILQILARRGFRFLKRVLRKFQKLPFGEQLVLNRILHYDPDVIHAHDLPQLRVAVLARRKLGVPLVYDAHEFYPEIHTLTPRQKRMLARRENTYLRETDVALTVNPLLAELMARRYGVPPLEVVENAIDPPPGFDPRARHDRFRSCLPIPADAKILLYQGWLALYRGLGTLVEAMPAVARNVHLVFMGYGADKEQLQATARKLAVADRVHFTDAVTHEDLLSWTASADVGIMPYQPVDLNNTNCSPSKLYEYVQAGLAILSNDLPYCRRVVAGEDFGLVRKLDTPQSFADAVNSIFAAPAQLARYRANVLARRQRWSWQHEGRTILGIYERLTKAREVRRVA